MMLNVAGMNRSDGSDSRFQPRVGFLWAAVGTVVAVLLGADWIDLILVCGIGFVAGGAAQAFKGIWGYLIVFFTLTGLATWGLIHFVIK